MERSKKRKRRPVDHGLQRSLNGSAFTTCPLCSKQVALTTINLHLDSADCIATATSFISASGPCCNQSPDNKKQDAAALLPHAVRPVQQTKLQSNGRQALDLPTAALQPNQTPDSHGSKSRHPQHEADRVHTQTNSNTLVPAACQSHVASQDKTDSSAAADVPHALQSQGSGMVTYSLQPHAALNGEYIIHNFVTDSEAAALLIFVDAALPAWKESNFNGRHRGKRWGAEMDLSKRTVQHGSHPMPAELMSLVSRVQSVSLLRDFEPNEANAIDYCKSKGHWLKPHVDDRQLSTNKIVTLSLGCTATMTFNSAKRNHEVAVKLPACALQIITRDARYMYAHGIRNAALEGPRRVSITFRQSPMKN